MQGLVKSHKNALAPENGQWIPNPLADVPLGELPNCLIELGLPSDMSLFLVRDTQHHGYLESHIGWKL